MLQFYNCYSGGLSVANAKKILKRKVVTYVLTIAVTIVLMFGLLSYMQTRGQADYQKKMSLQPLLDEVVESLDLHTESVEALTRRFHNANQISVRLVALFLQSGAFNEIDQATDAVSAANALRNLTANSGMYSMMIANLSGDLILMDNVDFYRAAGGDFKYNLIKGVDNPDGAFTLVEYERLTVNAAGWQGTYKPLPDGRALYSPVETFIEASDGKTYHGYYYSTPILNEDGSPSGMYLIAMADASQMEKDIAGLTNMKDVLDSVGVGDSGFVFSLDPETGDFSFFEDTEGLVLTGESFRESGITDDILKDGYAGIQTIFGTEYFCVAKEYSSDVFGNRVVIAATIPETELYGARIFNVFWALLAFIVVGNLIITYAVIFQLDQIKTAKVFSTRKTLFTTKSGKEFYYNKALGLKIFPLLVIGLMIVFGVSIYTQTLSYLSTATRISESRIEEIGISVEKNTQRADTVSEFYNKQNLNKTMLLADILKRAPQLAFEYDLTDAVHYDYAKNPDGSVVTDQYGNPVLTSRYHPNLQALCKAYDFASMYIFNDQGRVIATSAQWWNFVLSEDPEAQSYAFRDVLVNADSLVQDLQTSDVGESEQYIGCAFFYYTYNDNGITRFATEYEYNNGITSEDGKIIVPKSAITRHRGLVQTSVSAHSIEDYISMSTVEYTIEGMKMFYDGYFVAFSADESHKVIYSPFKEGVTIPTRAAMFNGSFNGYITIKGVKYYSCIREAGGIYMGTLIPASTLFYLRNNVSYTTIIISLVSFLILLGFMLFSTSDEDDAIWQFLEERDQEEELIKSAREGLKGNKASFEITMPDGKKKTVKSAESRWSKRFTEWNKRSVEQKFSGIVTGCAVLFFLFVLVAVLFANYIFPEGSIMDYIINGELERGPNVFVLTRCAMLFILVLFGAKIVQKVINVLSSNLGARAETVGHLLESVIKYAGVIGIIFYSLYLMGLNTTSLLTSAGILSIVVGLGAQSLISDILAGIFIVFEGEFRVGDIVTVSDFRGTVIEIGIRTTKIEDFFGNIKIFNNSHISGVLNMTKEYSTIPIYLSIEYGESLEKVENILKEEFPNIKRKVRKIVNGPFYKGVSAMADSAVSLLVVAQCAEGDRAQVQRDLNRELYLVFNKHNINVPFPQVTVSYLKDEENKKANIKEKREAEQFVADQKRQSKGVDSPENDR